MQVHVIRPPKLYTTGDFVALFPSGGPFDVDKNYGYTYARSIVSPFICPFEEIFFEKKE